MAYDVFISYAHADRAWGDRLFADLATRGINAFQDKEELHAGQNWETALDRALVDSRHLVCLWSANATAWVHREINHFQREVELKGERNRRLMIVQLDDAPTAYASLQQIVEPDLKTAYQTQQGPPQGESWARVLKAVDAAVKLDKDAVVVPTALFTLTADEFEDISPAARNRVAERLGLDAAHLAQRYGAERRQWKPFGDEATSFAELMDGVKTQLDNVLAPRWVHWEMPEDKFLGDKGASMATAFASRMCSEHVGALVIDPFALCSANVLARLGSFTKCLAEEGVAIIAVPTRRADARTRDFRAWLSEQGNVILQPHFEPPLQPTPARRARFGVGLDDVSELLRLMRTSVGASPAMRRAKAPAARVLDNRRA